MPHEVRLPQLGFSVSEGTLVEWLVRDGERVSVGAALFSLENDKALQEIESPAAGTLRILRQAGTYEVGELLALIE